MCKNCKLKPVIKLHSGESLCKRCFIQYFERKARKTISKYKLIDKNDTIVVGLSGGKDSVATLAIFADLAKTHRGLKVVALSIDEGIEGYRKETLKNAKAICKELDVKLKIVSYKKEFGYSLDEMVKKLEMNPCTICGVLRRYLLNLYSRKLKGSKLATGHNLDDEAQSVMMNQFRSNVKASSRLGPLTGIVADERFVRRIKPFYLLSEKEIMLYAFLKEFPFSPDECPYAHEAYRSEVRDILNELEVKHPGVKNNVISSFLSTLPIIKDHYRKGPKRISYCKCGEPTSAVFCKACELLKKLK